MRALIKAGIFLVGLAAVMVGLSYNVLRAQELERTGETGNRAMASETRPVDAAVTSIKLAGPVDLKLTQGSTPSMVVRAEQRYLPKIVTTQSGNALTIDTRGVIINSHRPMVVELVLPNLAELRILGSGDAQVSGFSGNALLLQLNGSGDVKFRGKYQRVNATLAGSGDLTFDGGNADSVELALLGSGDATISGSAKSLSAKLAGSGDVHAESMPADSVTLSLMGSGDAHVHASKSINVSAVGSGDATVSGNPAQRSVSTAGSGEVRWQ